MDVPICIHSLSLQQGPLLEETDTCLPHRWRDMLPDRNLRIKPHGKRIGTEAGGANAGVSETAQRQTTQGGLQPQSNRLRASGYKYDKTRIGPVACNRHLLRGSQCSAQPAEKLQQNSLLPRLTWWGRHSCSAQPAEKLQQNSLLPRLTWWGRHSCLPGVWWGRHSCLPGRNSPRRTATGRNACPTKRTRVARGRLHPRCGCDLQTALNAGRMICTAMGAGGVNGWTAGFWEEVSCPLRKSIQ